MKPSLSENLKFFCGIHCFREDNMSMFPVLVFSEELFSVKKRYLSSVRILLPMKALVFVGTDSNKTVYKYHVVEKKMHKSHVFMFSS